MTQLQADIPNLTARRSALVDRLTTFRRHVIRHLLFAGAARVLAELILACIISLVLDRWLRLSLPARIVVLLMAACGLAYEVWHHLIKPLQIRGDLVGMAAAIDRAKGNRNGTSLAPRVATILELPDLLNREAPPSSPMVERAVIAADDALRNTSFESALDDRRHKINLGAIVAILAVTILFILLNLGTTGLWARRWFLGSTEPWPQSTYLGVIGLTDGKIIVPRGEPYTLRLTAIRNSMVPESISLRLRETNGPRTSAAMSKFAANDFRYDMPAIQSAVTVEAEGGDDDLDSFVIEPVDRPKITSLTLVSQHPTDKEPQTHNFSGQDADLAFLAKTNLKLEFAANVAIAQAKVDGAPAEVQRLADNRFAISWVHQEPVVMQIELLSDQAKLTSLPTPIAIGLKIDQPPRVSLSFTGVRQRITPMAKIPLTILARDDFGVAKIDLQSKAQFVDADKKQQTLTSSKSLFGPTHPASELEVQQKETFDVTGLKITPGTILALTASGTDECYLSPQTGTSRPATFQIVAPEELFREILLRQQGERAKFRKQIEESQNIKDSLNTMTDSKSAAALARRHRNVQREVLRIANSLSESMTELRLNGLGTVEAYDLMDKNVLNPLKQMDSELMTPQRDGFDALAAQNGKLEEVSARQDQIIERMQQILKQMSQWDSFVDVLNQLNEIIRLQEGVKVGTDGLKSKQTEDVFDK
ncbi:MAG TPA: hypothetical protein VHS31_19850 [Tepidisphaeraceae bacterium]|nr:hypothetical protein [Tepidisphaeraceae bacterium]